MSQELTAEYDLAIPGEPGMRPAAESARDLANRATAALLLVPAAPVIGLFYVLMKLVDRQPGPFLYRGLRMGQNKKPFTIYKIRTLAENAEAEIGGDILKPGTDLELRFGRFLRETRLDELPQLLNVLRGDMLFVGPRPVRRAVYEKQGKGIRNFDLRFRVKPGLTGRSQFLTPHRAPQRIRALIDNHYVRYDPGLLRNALFVAWTVWRVARKTCAHGLSQAAEALQMHRKGEYACDWRGMPRADARSATCRLLPDPPRIPAPLPVVPLDMNYYALHFAADANLAEEDEVSLLIETEGRHRGRRKTAHCTGVVYKKNVPADPAARARYVVFYRPVSPLNRYIVDQYLLHLSLVY